MIENFLRKIYKVRKEGLWRFEEVNGKYILIGGSLPEIALSQYVSKGSQNDSDGFSDTSSTSSNEEDSEGSMSENYSESKEIIMPSNSEDSDCSSN